MAKKYENYFGDYFDEIIEDLQGDLGDLLLIHFCRKMFFLPPFLGVF
jgi:hypothetical protein